MIRDIRLKLAITTAGYNQTSCKCDRRHVSIHGDGGGSLLRFVLIFYCVTVICGDSKNRMARGIEELQIYMKNKSAESALQGHCDLERKCDWSWDQSPNSFKKVKASSNSTLSKYFPTMDADGSTNGNLELVVCF